MWKQKNPRNRPWRIRAGKERGMSFRVARAISANAAAIQSTLLSYQYSKDRYVAGLLLALYRKVMREAGASKTAIDFHIDEEPLAEPKNLTSLRIAEAVIYMKRAGFSCTYDKERRVLTVSWNDGQYIPY